MEKHFTPFIFLINGLVVMQEFHEIFTKHSLMWFHDNILKKMFLFEDQFSSDHESNMNHRLIKYLLHSYLKFQFVFTYQRAGNVLLTFQFVLNFFSDCIKFKNRFHISHINLFWKFSTWNSINWLNDMSFFFCLVIGSKCVECCGNVHNFIVGIIVTHVKLCSPSFFCDQF